MKIIKGKIKGLIKTLETMTSTLYSKTNDDTPDLPLEHYVFNHNRFPVGKSIPCLIQDVYIDSAPDQGPKIVVVVRYGPYIKKEVIHGRELEHYIKQKFLYVEYTCDDSYELATLFSSYDIPPSEGRYPDFEPRDKEEKEKFLGYFEKVFKDFFLHPPVFVYVDTDLEVIWNQGMRKTFTYLISKLNPIK
jgi:hypothetical protein